MERATGTTHTEEGRTRLYGNISRSQGFINPTGRARGPQDIQQHIPSQREWERIARSEWPLSWPLLEHRACSSPSWKTRCRTKLDCHEGCVDWYKTALGPGDDGKTPKNSNRAQRYSLVNSSISSCNKYLGVLYQVLRSFLSNQR